MPQDDLSTTFAALADPTRRAILARLASGEASVTELGKPFAMSLPAISKHLKVLERAGLIARVRDAQWRSCAWRRLSSKTRPSGWRNTGVSGKKASIVWTTIWANCKKLAAGRLSRGR